MGIKDFVNDPYFRAFIKLQEFIRTLYRRRKNEIFR